MRKPTPLPELDRSVDPYAGLHSSRPATLHSSPAPLTPRERQYTALRYRLAIAMLIVTAVMYFFY